MLPAPATLVCPHLPTFNRAPIAGGTPGSCGEADVRHSRSQGIRAGGPIHVWCAKSRLEVRFSYCAADAIVTGLDPLRAGESWTGTDEAAAEAELEELEAQMQDAEILEMPAVPQTAVAVDKKEPAVPAAAQAAARSVDAGREEESPQLVPA